MILEVLNPVVGSKTVPMNSKEIDVASTAVFKEGGEICETLVLVRTIADGGRTELNVTVVLGVEGFHVFVPAVDRLANVHVSLTAEVGFVEGEKVLGASSDGSFGVGFPVWGVVRGKGVPKHGDEFFGRVNGTAGRGVPVIHPTDVGVVECGG